MRSPIERVILTLLIMSIFYGKSVNKYKFVRKVFDCDLLAD
jgi:hypothetical protein